MTDVAGAFELKLDKEGIAEILKGAEMQAMVAASTEQIASVAKAALPQGTEVETSFYTTDRAAGNVTIADGRGMVEQAENGVLSKAALGIGAEFKGGPE